MAGATFGDAGAGKRAHLYEHKITAYFIFACIVAALGGSLFGYDLGVSGGVTSMDDFLKEFFPKVYRRKHAKLNETDYCKYDNQILTLFTSSLYFAALVSTFGASVLTRKKGRRASILFGSVSFFLGGIVNAFAKNIAMLIIGRTLLGFGIGFGNQAVPLYLSEMAPPKVRGAVNQLFQPRKHGCGYEYGTGTSAGTPIRQNSKKVRYGYDCGHPALIGRHRPFPVTHQAAERWLYHMQQALDCIADIDADSKIKMNNFFRHTAFFLVAGNELKNQNQGIACKHGTSKPAAV